MLKMHFSLNVEKLQGLIFADQCLKESTKAAAPAFTFAGKYEQKVKSVAPSPNTYNTAGLTAKGKHQS